MLFTCKFTVFIVSLFMFAGVTKSNTATSGPFHSYISLVRKCVKPTYPWQPNPTITLDVELYNHTTKDSSLRGSFNVLNYTTGFKIRTKSMIWENGKWKTNFIVVDNGCRGSMMPFLMSLLNVRFDKQKCAFLECRIPIDIQNTNKIHHIMTKTAEYGRVMYTSEMFMKGKQYKTVYCHEYETVIEPI